MATPKILDELTGRLGKCSKDLDCVLSNNPTGLDSVVENGWYTFIGYDGDTPTAGDSCESVWLLEVIACSTELHIRQEASTVYSKVPAVRTSNDGGSTWTPWELMAEEVPDHSHDAEEITNLINEMIITLPASGWISSGDIYEQTVTVDRVAATTKAIASIAMTASLEQMTAAANAILHVSGQADNSITVKAFGTVPEIDIPVQLTLLGSISYDTAENLSV